METILGMLGGQVIPIVVLGLVLVTISILLTVARNYYKVSPNEVAVITGRSYVLTDPDGKKVKRGFRVVTGGGFFKFPVLERVDVIKLNILTIPVQVENVPDKNGALVSVIGVTNVKILSDAQSLPLAVERFLGFTDEQITDVARENLEGNLRAIVGTMEIEELIRDRQALQTKILSEAVADLAKLGLGVDLLTIKDINDERNYIGSLGKKRTAEVVRDATIGEAEAMRDANIKSAEARQLGETAKAKADQAISDANRERDMVIADNTAKVGAQQARIPIAAQIATAEETKELNIANVAAEQARIEAETNLQAAERKRHEAELEASTIVQAEKDRESKVIAADAEQQAATKTGEAGRIIAEKAGQGTQAKLTGEAIGRKAAAEALQAELDRARRRSSPGKRSAARRPRKRSRRNWKRKRPARRRNSSQRRPASRRTCSPRQAVRARCSSPKPKARSRRRKLTRNSTTRVASS